MRIDKIMSKPVVTIEMDDSLKVVKEIFDNTGFHHLMVVDSKKLLVGVVSDRDLLKAISPNIGTIRETVKDVTTLNKKVHQIMSRDPITLSPTAGIYDAIRIFNSHTISCIPIIDNEQRPVGIISWRDILKEIIHRVEKNK